MKQNFAARPVGPDGLLNFIGLASANGFHFAAIPMTTFSLPKGLSKKILLLTSKI